MRVVLMMQVLCLVGCRPALATPEVPPTPSATKVVDTDTPTPPTRTPTPTPTPFVPKAVIKIVVDTPLSGNQALFGRDILRGAALAIQKLSDPLMERGFQIDLVSYDDRNSLDTALANTKEIVADPDVLCAIGHLTPRLTVQVSQQYHQAGLALFAPTTASVKLTEDGYREINRVIGREDLQGIAGAHFAKSQGFTDVYIISQKDEYGLRNAENFRLQADVIGIQVLGMFMTDLITDPALVLKDMLAAKPELVYYAGRADHAIPFFKEARAAGYRGAFLGLDDLNNPPLMEFAGPSLVKNGGLYFTILTPPAKFFPGASQFIQDFKTHFGTSPLLFATRAYDAAGMCIKAIETASKAKGGRVPTRTEVVDAIRSLKNYKGITGTYTFNDQGDITSAKYYVYRVVSVEAANWEQNSIIASYDVIPP
jgi:branched-chain amino acid transport system substrate-binding protein